MAKLIDLLTFSGTVGDMVGCMGPSGFYVRSRPRKSTKPPTTRQLETRAKMALVTTFLNPLRELIYLGFASPKDRRSKAGAFGRATAHAIEHAVEGTYPDLTINPAQIQLSTGGLQTIPNPSVVLEESLLKVIWTWHESQLNAFSDDTVYVLAYHAQQGVLTTVASERRTGEAIIDISAEPPGSPLLVYVCVAERYDKRFSNSQFLGVVNR